MTLIYGFLLSSVIAYLAWRARSLTRSGAWMAVITGGLVFGLGGVSWAALLLAFFISSSALSRFLAARKAGLNEKYAKGSQRDWGQVLANGGLGAALALAYGIFPGERWLWFAYIGAMAAVTADTWATEIGVFSPALPRMITSGKPVERGTSGGVTLLGYGAVLLAGAFIGAVAAITGVPTSLAVVISAAFAGLIGSTIDSLLGATLQAIYYCPACEKETERHPQHSCGADTDQLRGWSWLNNDVVNFACSLAGAGAALLVGYLFL
jgi:uncharacterized protein (TIGR00297 family)